MGFGREAVLAVLACAASKEEALELLVASGEASGNVGQMLDRAAAEQERELESLTSGFLAVLEPLLLELHATDGERRSQDHVSEDPSERLPLLALDTRRQTGGRANDQSAHGFELSRELLLGPGLGALGEERARQVGRALLALRIL